GAVSDDETIRMCAAMAACGVAEIGLSDTSGYANPAQVRRLVRRLQTEFGSKAGGAHFPNTRGQGLANVVAALEVGVTNIDSSQAGLGGCPYAPGATG
ncbi:hydroxymethylglutaryl-CoA lyase, partial [Paraburkholderia sp. SIMBA_061]